MYDWPEERGAVDALWARIRAGTDAQLPRALARPASEAALFALWRDPALVLSQTCWGPLRMGLLPGLRVLAQPDYSDVPGGSGPLYRSAVIGRSGAARPVPEGRAAALPKGLLAGRVLAVNARHSLSGWLALAADLGADPGTRAASVVLTGGHRASIRAVAAGRADLAAIDCRSWALAQHHEPCAAGLVVLGWTAARPGLPYVTGANTDPALAAGLQATLIGMGCHPPQEEFA
ncbi:MAG: ABC-type phosphate/phosphonate transport system, periplasmic component [Rhodobacteraceae bacterium HLUCCA12]|nr:MAG: ABC-type phosphate/phosphonate transport system, periplasmic component [Rhodobacteraceae bacterium HLUCCA12]